jgi:coatomer protein complex subunit gamma
LPCLCFCRLTEEDTEYVIHAIKHVFPSHLVVQFNCTNTIKEQRLENVTVLMDLADAVRDIRA